MLYQLSYEASLLGAGQFVGFMPRERNELMNMYVWNDSYIELRTNEWMEDMITAVMKQVIVILTLKVQVD